MVVELQADQDHAVAIIGTDQNAIVFVLFDLEFHKKFLGLEDGFADGEIDTADLFPLIHETKDHLKIGDEKGIFILHFGAHVDIHADGQMHFLEFEQVILFFLKILERLPGFDFHTGGFFVFFKDIGRINQLDFI